MFLDYLVTSKTKRELFRLFVVDGVEGSVTELAQLSGAPYSCVFDELNEMEKHGLVECLGEGRKQLFKSVLSRDQRSSLLGLFSLDSSSLENSEKEKKLKKDSNVLKSHLAHYGAPVLNQYDGELFLSLEETFALGVELSKKDAVLMRSLPVFVWKNRNHLNYDLLLMYSRRYKVKREVGFLLSLTSKLKKNSKLSTESKKFFDRRKTTTESYFSKERTLLQKSLEELRTPKLARKWSFSLNMELSNFKSFLDKHIGTSDQQSR